MRSVVSFLKTYVDLCPMSPWLFVCLCVVDVCQSDVVKPYSRYRRLEADGSCGSSEVVLTI